uniref:PKD domain-containing protein n=1 Tax=Paractinoplanes polyasparticus TaxID=2856853 RepID=UPI001C8501C0|nr:PKD domain-containing protein [Actinoplanes polyasparticus]
MKSRLSRPLLAAVVSGAFLVGGGIFAAPALAEPPPPGAPESTSTPTTEPTTTAPVTTPPPPTDLPATTPPVTETTPPPATTEPPTETTPPVTTPPATTTPPVTTPPPTTTTPPPVDKTAPTGAIGVNRWSIFPGQSITLTLSGIKDNVSPAAQIKRVVTWGDGTSSTVNPTAKTVAHTYKSSGKKPITLTLTDAAGNKRVLKSSGPTVVPQSVKYKLSRTTVFHGQKFVWELLSVPAGATKITIAWGDGRATVLTKPKKQKITRHYYSTPDNKYIVDPGVKTIKVTAYNKYGAATPQVAGKVSLKNDTSRPVVRVTAPSKPSKASSWKAVKGTATDTGSGIKEMAMVTLVLKTNNNAVCYAPSKKKWLNANNDTPDACVVVVKPSKGKFSTPLKSTPKGQLGIIAIAADWAGNMNSIPESTFPFVHTRRIS